MHLDTITVSELGPEMVNLWRELQASDPCLVSPFFAPEYAQSIGAVFDNFRIGVLENADGICGFLPFHRTRSGRGVPPGGHLCDYQGVVGGLPEGITGPQLMKGLGLTAFDYNHVPSDQQLFRAGAYYSSVSPRADLSEGYTAWEQDVSAKTKRLKKLAREERKMIRDFGPLRFEVQDERPEGWASFSRWKNDSLQQQGTSGLFQQGWDAAVIDIIRQHRGQYFESRFSTLYAGDRLVAAHFGLCSDRAWHWWFPTYDPSLGNLSSGLILMRHCIEAAAADGMTEVDFGRGTQRYKIEFSNRNRALCEGSLERADRPLGVLRCARKLVQRQAFRSLPPDMAQQLQRAGSRLLKAGRL